MHAHARRAFVLRRYLIAEQSRSRSRGPDGERCVVTSYAEIAQALNGGSDRIPWSARTVQRAAATLKAQGALVVRNGNRGGTRMIVKP